MFDKLRKVLQVFGIYIEEVLEEEEHLSSTKKERERFKRDWEMFSKIKGQTAAECLAAFKESSGAKELREQLEFVEEDNYIHQQQPRSYSDEMLRILSDAKKENFERKVGETFDYEGTTLEVCEGDSCSSCFFKDKHCDPIKSLRGECLSDNRLDKLEVVFKEVKPKSEGLKLDQGKLSYTLLPFKALAEVTKVLEFGKQKYAKDNWQKVANGKERYLDAAFRHLVAYLEGESKDPESGLHHLAHATCCLLFILWFDLTGTKEANKVL